MHLSTDRALLIVQALASIGADKDILHLGATNIRAASRRTLSFDIPPHPLLTSKEDPTPTVTRIKVVAHSNGTVSVRFLEAHMVDSIVPQETEYATQHGDESVEMFPHVLGEFLKASIGFGA